MLLICCLGLSRYEESTLVIDADGPVTYEFKNDPVGKTILVDNSNPDGPTDPGAHAYWDSSIVTRNGQTVCDFADGDEPYWDDQGLHHASKTHGNCLMPFKCSKGHRWVMRAG